MLKIKLIVIKINSIVTDKTCSIIYDCNTNRLICATFNSVVSKIDSVEKKALLSLKQSSQFKIHNTFLESTASTPRLWTGQLVKQERRNGRGIETEMGNTKSCMHRDDSGLLVKIEPETSLTLACETNQGQLGTYGSLICS